MRTCPNGHDRTDVTPSGECRQCVRARQVRWSQTARGEAARARHEATSKRLITRGRAQDSRIVKAARATFDERFGS